MIPRATPIVTSASGGLVLRDLSVRYGQSRALSDLSLCVEGGAVLAVLGPNGAGKSTLGRAVAGLVPVEKGVIEFDGADITKVPPHRVRRAGLVYIPEDRGIFPGLSVIDNLRMAARICGGSIERASAVEQAFDLFPILSERRRQQASSLSGGEQQMLALARALSTRPRLIVADEMSLGLAPMLVTAVFDGLEKARSLGITIVLIEQYIHRALAFADHCAILSRGTVGWAGAASEAGPEVLDHYLGQAAD